MKKLCLLVLVAALSFAWAQTQWEYGVLEWTELDSLICVWITEDTIRSENTCLLLYMELTNDIQSSVPVAFARLLDYFGAQGWELVTAVKPATQIDVTQYTFKRAR